jgi:hypothetical protein
VFELIFFSLLILYHFSSRFERIKKKLSRQTPVSHTELLFLFLKFFFAIKLRTVFCPESSETQYQRTLFTQFFIYFSTIRVKITIDNNLCMNLRLIIDNRHSPELFDTFYNDYLRDLFFNHASRKIYKNLFFSYNFFYIRFYTLLFLPSHDYLNDLLCKSLRSRLCLNTN